MKAAFLKFLNRASISTWLGERRLEGTSPHSFAFSRCRRKNKLYPKGWSLSCLDDWKCQSKNVYICSRRCQRTFLHRAGSKHRASSILLLYLEAPVSRRRISKMQWRSCYAKRGSLRTYRWRMLWIRHAKCELVLFTLPHVRDVERIISLQFDNFIGYLPHWTPNWRFLEQVRLRHPKSQHRIRTAPIIWDTRCKST